MSGLETGTNSEDNEASRHLSILNRKISRRKAIGTSAKVGVAAVAAAVVAGGVGYYAGTQTTNTQQTTSQTQTSSSSNTGGTQLSGQISIGWIGGLTGYSQAPLNLKSYQAAVSDFNAYVKSLGQNWSINLIPEDGQYSAAVSLQKLQALVAQGVKIVCGPDSSGQMAGMEAYAQSNQIILFSESATSDTLAVPKPFLFRGVPSNILESHADVKVAVTRGAKFIGLFASQQSGSQNSANDIVTVANAAGITDIQRIDYPVGTTDFSTFVALMNTNVTGAVSKYGQDAVVIMTAGVDNEISAMLQTSTQYPALLSVPWICTSGSALGSLQITNTGAQAYQARMISTTFSIANSPYNTQVAAELNQAAGQSVGVYGLISYDVLWCVGLALLQLGKLDTVALNNTMIEISQHIYGSSGPFGLNANGDRATGNEQYWAVSKNSDGTYSWALYGTYDSGTDAATFTQDPFTAS